jgi:hypothetical protein
MSGALCTTNLQLLLLLLLLLLLDGPSPTSVCHPAVVSVPLLLLSCAATCASIYPATVRSSGFNLGHNMAMSWLGEWSLLCNVIRLCLQPAI